MIEKYRIEGDYLVTDDPVIQATATPSHTLTNSATGIVTAYIAKPQVREALKAVEGAAFFTIPVLKYWSKKQLKKDGVETCPRYYLDFKANYDGGPSNAGLHFVAVNDLTIGKTCGEIRKLIEWSKP